MLHSRSNMEPGGQQKRKTTVQMRVMRAEMWSMILVTLLIPAKDKGRSPRDRDYALVAQC